MKQQRNGEVGNKTGMSKNKAGVTSALYIVGIAMKICRKVSKLISLGIIVTPLTWMASDLRPQTVQPSTSPQALFCTSWFLSAPPSLDRNDGVSSLLRLLELIPLLPWWLAASLVHLLPRFSSSLSEKPLPFFLPRPQSQPPLFSSFSFSNHPSRKTSLSSAVPLLSSHGLCSDFLFLRLRP